MSSSKGKSRAGTGHRRSSSASPEKGAAAGEPFLPRPSRSSSTSPEKGAAAVAVGERIWGLSIDEPGMALPEQAMKHNEDDDDLLYVEMVGVGAPTPIKGFEEAELTAMALQNVGYVVLTLLQRFAFPVIMAGMDLLVVSSAKSASSYLPVVTGFLRSKPRIDIAQPRAVILARTRRHAKKIKEEAEKCSDNTNLSVVMATADSSMFSQRGVDILVATPEHLLDMVRRSTISLKSTMYFVVDGIDRMLDMGLDTMVIKLVELGMPQKAVRQTLIFTSTLTPEIQRVALELLSDHIVITIGPVLSTDQIKQKVVLLSDREKNIDLLRLLQKQSIGLAKEQPLTLIFVETTFEAVSLSSWLCNEGFAATVLHGNTTQQERESALKSFKSGLSPILVASDAASWGLDVQNIAHVINYDLPKTIEGYIHRIRRTGKHGLATSFFTESNLSLVKGLTKLLTRMKQDVPEFLVEYDHKMQPREYDPPFDYLVDKFINAIAADVKASASLDEIDYKAIHQRQTNEYANVALLHHNCEGDKKVKYELVEAITSYGILDSKGLYVHVNFTAMNTQNSKVDFFFAELRWDSDKETSMPTCVVSLEEDQRVGGLYGTDCIDYKDGMNIRVDLQHCYACGADLKHPVDGKLYEIGHKAMSECYRCDP